MSQSQLWLSRPYFQGFKLKIKSVITQLVVFLLPILAALYNTFELPDFTRSIIWDSAHYVLSGKLLSSWLADLSHGHYVSPHDCEMGYSLLLLTA
jgi:hypothetical protein